MANVQAGYLGAMSDTVDESESLSWASSIETILDEIDLGANIFREGKLQEMATTFANIDSVTNTNLARPVLNP